MTTSLVKGVDFVHVGTKDWEASRDFYAKVLGLEPSAEYNGVPGGEFETGNLTIQIIQSDAIGRQFEAGTNPIALRVDDVDAARSELESKGVSFVRETIDSGVCHMAIFEDPDGNLLMLHHRYAPKGD